MYEIKYISYLKIDMFAIVQRKIGALMYFLIIRISNYRGDAEIWFFSALLWSGVFYL